MGGRPAATASVCCLINHPHNLVQSGGGRCDLDSLTMRSFVGIDLGCEPAPDQTTVCNFRRLLVQHGLGRKMLTPVNGYLDLHGLKIGTGTVLDATILPAPSSTENKDHLRDREMHQVEKGNQGTSA